MVKGKFMISSVTSEIPPHRLEMTFLSCTFLETPPSSYWKEVAEERRKALYRVLQENEKVS